MLQRPVTRESSSKGCTIDCAPPTVEISLKTVQSTQAL